MYPCSFSVLSSHGSQGAIFLGKLYSGELLLMRNFSTKLFVLTVCMGFMVLGFLMVEEGEANVSINGVVCNHSSSGVWLSVSEGERQKAYSLAPGRCTDFFTQDAEAICGRDCHTGFCQYQAWKVGAGRYDVYNNAGSSLSSILQIEGWGAGSSWHITREWPRPDLSSVSYSLVR